MSHTKGKLKADGDWIGLESDGDVTVAYIDASDDEETNEANARRLVVCWNALEPYPTELIEKDWKTLYWNRKYIAQQRDEVVNAAEEYIRAVMQADNEAHPQAYKNLRAVLDRVKE